MRIALLEAQRMRLAKASGNIARTSWNILPSTRKKGALALIILALLAGLCAVGRTRALEGPDGIPWNPLNLVTVLPKDNAVWSDLQPSGWVRSPLTATITVQDPDGLQAATAVYYISTDEGGSWIGAFTPDTYSPVSHTVYITCPNLTFPDGSRNRIRFEILDAMGEVEGTPVGQIPTLWVDGAEPDSTVSTSGTFGLDWTGQIMGTATDEVPGVDSSGVAVVEITIRRQDPAGWWDGSLWDSEPRWLPTGGSPTSWSYSFAPTNGEAYTLQSRATDNAGNVESIYGLGAFSYHIAPPAAPTDITPEPLDTWTNTNCFTVTWTNPVGDVPVVGAYYSFTEPTSENDYDGFVTGEGASTVECLSVAAQGRYDFYVWLEDELGNRDFLNYGYRPNAFSYDTTPPIVTAAYDREPNVRGWFTDTVNLNLFCADGTPDVTSGCAPIEWRLAGEEVWQRGGFLPVSSDANRTFEARGTDFAGNMQDVPITITVPIDLHAPESVHVPEPTGWYTAPITVAIVISDATSGPDASFYMLDGTAWRLGNSFEIAEEGKHTIQYYSRDIAGNVEVPRVFTDEYWIDTVAPTTRANYTSTVGCNEWRAEIPVFVDLEASDPSPGSNLDHIEYLPLATGTWQTGNRFPESREGLWFYQARAVDVAGNVGASVPITVGIDLTPPATPRLLQATPAGWSNVPVFTLSWQDPADHDPSSHAPFRYAYSRLDAAPSQDRDPAATRAELANSTMQVTVSEEGEHDVYLWLEDCAENVSYLSRIAEPNLLKYDASPPETGYQETGEKGLDPAWYVSDVTVSLTPADAVSAPAITRYQIDDGPWQDRTGSPVIVNVSGDGRLRRVQYHSVDMAGNAEATQQTFLNIDTTAPSSPIGLWVYPVQCTRGAEFTLSWTNPDELSGVGKVWYTIGLPPAHGSDGTSVSGAVGTIAVQMPEQSDRYAIYVWLEDRAGNVDHTTAASVMVCRDIDPPVTVATADCARPGENGWCKATVLVRLNAGDSMSGLSQIRYRLDNGVWQTESIAGCSVEAEIQIPMNAEGARTLDYYAVDCLGNEEGERSELVKVDLKPPRAWIGASAYSESATFTVSWGGSDITPSGTVERYDVQVRTDASGVWADWLMGVPDTSGSYTGEAGHIYYFRVRATDAAGRRGSYSSDAAVYTYVDPLTNGDFSDGLKDWIAVEADLPVQHVNSNEACSVSPEVVLGNPSLGWGDFNVPLGRAALRREIRVPSTSQVPGLSLSFWYRMITFDLLEWPEYPNDSFDVTIIDQQGAEHPIMRDGNVDPLYAPPPASLFDLGCKELSIDLTRFAGQTITIELASWNRHDPWYNSYTYVDNARLSVPRRVYLPLIDTGPAGSGGGSAIREPLQERTRGPRDGPPRRR